jgi:hypothetical protein
MKKMNQSHKPFEMAHEAEKALKEAVHNLIVERAKNNDTIVIWKNGKVATVPAKNYL